MTKINNWCLLPCLWRSQRGVLTCLLPCVALLGLALLTSPAPTLAAPALAPGQATTFYSIPVPAGLAGWWTGDGNPLDSTGNNKARLYGDADYAPGEVGQGFHFDGLKGYAKIIPTNADIEAKEGLTVELWIRPDDVAKKQPLLGWSNGEDTGVSLWLEPGKKPGLAVLGADIRDTKGGSHVLATGAGVVKVGEFQHIALTYDLTTGEGILYYNGRPVALQLMDVFTPNTKLDLWLGRHASVDGGNTLFAGVMDEISVYRRALAASEVEAVYKAASAGKSILVPLSPTATEAQREDAQKQAYTDRLSSFSAKDKAATFTFDALIDGSDEVHVQGDKLWYVHRNFAFPGKYGEGNLPTQVNLEDWVPNWTGNVSDKTTLIAPMPTTGVDKNHIVQAEVSVLRAGGPATIQQLPTPENNYEMMLLLDDDLNLSAHWYTFSVHWKIVPASMVKP